jgi:hypothetical protein
MALLTSQFGIFRKGESGFNACVRCNAENKGVTTYKTLFKGTGLVIKLCAKCMPPKDTLVNDASKCAVCQVATTEFAVELVDGYGDVSFCGGCTNAHPSIQKQVDYSFQRSPKCSDADAADVPAGKRAALGDDVPLAAAPSEDEDEEQEQEDRHPQAPVAHGGIVFPTPPAKTSVPVTSTAEAAARVFAPRAMTARPAVATPKPIPALVTTPSNTLASSSPLRKPAASPLRKPAAAAATPVAMVVDEDLGSFL